MFYKAPAITNPQWSLHFSSAIHLTPNTFFVIPFLKECHMRGTLAISGYTLVFSSLVYSVDAGDVGSTWEENV